MYNNIIHVILLGIHLAGENDEKTAENVDEVEEQVNGVPEIVGISKLKLLDNELSVKQDETTEQDQAKVELKLEREREREREREKCMQLLLHQLVYTVEVYILGRRGMIQGRC